MILPAIPIIIRKMLRCLEGMPRFVPYFDELQITLAWEAGYDEAPVN